MHTRLTRPPFLHPIFVSQVISIHKKQLKSNVKGELDVPLPTHYYGKSLYKTYIVCMKMGYNPQESLKNTINTMGTLPGVQPTFAL